MIFLLALAAFALGVPLTATWNVAAAGLNASIVYTVDISPSPSKTAVWMPGEEVTLSFAARDGLLKVDLEIPRDVPIVGGRKFSYSFDVPPGAAASIDVEVAPSVKARLYVKMGLVARVSARGAEPSYAEITVPGELRLKAQGSAVVNATVYAKPALGFKLVFTGVEVTLFERELAPAPLKPPLVTQIDFPTLYLAPALAAASAAILLFALRRRVNFINKDA